MAWRSGVESDRCPGVIDLHTAEDGALARVRLPAGRVSARQLAAIAAGAALGNGLVDLTSRANLQLRGLPLDAGVELERVFERGHLLPSVSHERVRNILASPLAGRHPASRAQTDDLVDEFDAGLRADPALAALSGRFLFAFDDGSRLLDGERADIALVADDAGTFSLRVGGSSTTICVARQDAAELALRAARAFLAIADGAWRVADLEDGGLASIGALGGEPLPLARATRPVLRPGVTSQLDGLQAITALAPLGRLDARQLEGLLELVTDTHTELRVSPWRTITIPDLSPNLVPDALEVLTRLGLVLSPESGWFGLTACAGLGACPKARIDVRAAAAHRAARRDRDSGLEHWSACPRRCGQSTAASTDVAAEDGLVMISADGVDRTFEDVDAALLHLAEGVSA
jgi:sulfite reductase beta subunit-like hemoprotein